MPKVKISEYSATANSNTDVASINIDEGCAPSGINNAIRAIMGHLKDFQSGTSNDPFTIGSSGSLTLSYGTANGVAYLNGSKVVTSGSVLTFDGAILGVNGISVGRGAGAVATNTAVGYQALNSNTNTLNTAVGYRALTTNTSGQAVTAVGSDALRDNSTGSRNTAVGYGTLANNNTGENNSAVGQTALGSNTTGTNNSALGYDALGTNTSGAYNTALGKDALNKNTTASNNTAVGYQALYTNTSTGSENTAVGTQALYSNTDAYYNVAVGYRALYADTTGNQNAAVGFQAGVGITTASGVVAIGVTSATTLTTGLYGTYIGYQSTASAAGATSEIVVCAGGSATAKGSSTGFISPNNGAVYQGNNSAVWATTSDRRLKKNIVDNNIGLEKITAIQVRNFEYRLPEEVDAELKPTDAIKKSGVQLGVIAQELNEVLPECIKTESTGVMSVNSDNLTWYMINAIKELKAEVDSLKAQINGASA